MFNKLKQVLPIIISPINHNRRRKMSVVKVIEIIAEGNSIEDAVEKGLERAGETVEGIQNIYIKDIKAKVENNKVSHYRLILKVSFLLKQ